MALTIAIDGQEARVEPGTTILQAAQDVGVFIPTLCYHGGVRPYRACQICRVELEDEQGNRRLAPACTMPIRREGQKVHTQSQLALDGRREALRTLLASHPQVDWLWAMAEELGVPAPKSPVGPAPEGCILCGLCARTCSEVLGVRAITYDRARALGDAGLPLQVDPSVCIGCGACASVCPTGVIQVADRDGHRQITWWGLETVQMDLQQCSDCGAYFAVPSALAKARDRAERLLSWADVCPDCRGLRARQRLASAGGAT